MANRFGSLGMRDLISNFPNVLQGGYEKRNSFDVNYEPIETPDYWNKLATEGYGQAGMRDMLAPQVEGAQQQYLGQRGQFRGAMGARGLYDSSIRSRGEAGLIGQREAKIGLAESNITQQNQKIMMEGQRVLEDIRRFNAQNQFQADITNKQTALGLYQQDRSLDMQQQQLDEQKRQGQWDMASGLLGIATSFIPGL
jgi:hypothetical protein